MASFEAEVQFLVNKTEKNMLRVMQASIQDVVDASQKPRGKGGRMPIDTGFLRASGQGSYSGMPSGPVRGDKKEPNSYTYDSGPIGVLINGLTVGKTFYFGWTANYARIQNLRTGFLDAAVQRWQEFVDRNAIDLTHKINQVRGSKND
jgi:hypothetical protein